MIFKDAKADTQAEVLGEGAASFLDPERRFIAGTGAWGLPPIPKTYVAKADVRTHPGSGEVSVACINRFPVCDLWLVRIA
ncbi:MAG: hypothetical protein ACREH8_08190 [Opitutaceae bacterium]